MVSEDGRFQGATLFAPSKLSVFPAGQGIVGIDSFWGLPGNPRTPYCRTFETPVTDRAHLYEFVVPMVPPTWNDRDRVQRHAQLLLAGSLPAAVAVSTLDISRPAMAGDNSDYYEHWALTHFLLDGHHKLEAAAAARRPLQLLALVAIDASLAGEADIRRLLLLRAQDIRQRAIARICRRALDGACAYARLIRRYGRFPSAGLVGPLA